MHLPCCGHCFFAGSRHWQVPAGLPCVGGVGVTTVMGVETQAALDLHLPPKNPVIGMLSLKHKNKI